MTTLSKDAILWVFRIRIRYYLFGSGSRSFHHQANPDWNCFITSVWLGILKTVENVTTKSTVLSKKNLVRKPLTKAGSAIQCTDPRFRKRLKMSPIRITATYIAFNQGCGSGSVLDPYSIGSVDPDPYSQYGSGSRRAKMTHKSRSKSSCFEVLDGLFWELKASSITWIYFMEA
jgi:hypothetical protein